MVFFCWMLRNILRHFCQDYVLFVLQSWTLWQSVAAVRHQGGRGPLSYVWGVAAQYMSGLQLKMTGWLLSATTLNVCVSARLCVRESVVALRAVMSSPDSPQDLGALSSRSSAEATLISFSKSTFWSIFLNTLYCNWSLFLTYILEMTSKPLSCVAC